MGLALDQAILTGTGATEPQGIIGATGVNTLDFGGSVAATLQWGKLEEAVEKNLIGNFPGELSAMTLVWHPTSQRLFNALRDTTNQPIQRSPSFVQPGGVRIMQTTNLTAPDNGTAVLGAFGSVLIGVRMPIRIDVLDAGQNADGNNVVDSYQRTIRVAWRGDVAILQPGWLCSISNIDT